MTLLQGEVGAEENSGLCVQRGAVSFALLGGKSHVESEDREGFSPWKTCGTAARVGGAGTAEQEFHVTWPG